MIRVHHLESSRSQRILWLLEELELDYEITHYARDPQTQRAPASMREVHPLGKSPILEHGGTVLAESGAIVEYVVNRLAGGRLGVAPDADEYADYLYWLHFAEGSGAFPVVLGILLDVTGAEAELLKGMVAAEAAHTFDFIEARLAASPFLAGAELTAADVMSSFVLQMGAARGRLSAEERPAAVAYLEGLQKRPAFLRAAAKGAAPGGAG